MIIQPSKKSPLASTSKPGRMSPSDKNKLDEIILFLAKELDKGYNLYLPFNEKSESDEIDEYLTLEAGIIIRQAKCILQDIKEEIEKERKWMSNPRADERRASYR